MWSAGQQGHVTELTSVLAGSTGPSLSQHPRAGYLAKVTLYGAPKLPRERGRGIVQMFQETGRGGAASGQWKTQGFESQAHLFPAVRLAGGRSSVGLSVTICKMG